MKISVAWLALAAAGCLFPGGRAAAQSVAGDPALYSCRVYVTGTDMRSRPGGLERCVRDVLVKVSGDRALAEDPRVLALGKRASAMVQDFAYLDSMTDVPTHDEQGTRDRPFDLVGHVDPKKAAAVLTELGVGIWLSPRPVLLALVDVQREGPKFELSADGPLGERQRRALLEAGETYGLRVSFPTLAQLGSMDRSAPDPTGLGIGPEDGGTAVLTGSLSWSDADAGWNCTWRFDAGSGAEAWTVRGVSFDEAFRAGVGTAAKMLAVRSR